MILKECAKIESKEVGIRNLYPVKESAWTDKSKYFRFHKIHYHNTNDVIHLKMQFKR